MLKSKVPPMVVDDSEIDVETISVSYFQGDVEAFQPEVVNDKVVVEVRADPTGEFELGHRTPMVAQPNGRMRFDPAKVKREEDAQQLPSATGRRLQSPSKRPDLPEEVALLLNFSQNAKQPDKERAQRLNSLMRGNSSTYPMIPAQGPLNIHSGPHPKILRRVPAIQPDQIRLSAFLPPEPKVEVDCYQTYMEDDLPIGDEVSVATDFLGEHDYFHSTPFSVKTIRQRACLTSPITSLHVEREKKFGRKPKLYTSLSPIDKSRPKRGRPPRYPLPPDTKMEDESRVREKETQRRARVAKKNRLINQREVVDKVYSKVTQLLTDVRFDPETRSRLDAIKHGLYQILAERDKKSHHEIAAHMYKDYLRSEAGVIRRPGPLPKHMLPELANVTDPKERQRLRNCAAQRRYREATNAQEQMYNEVVHKNVPDLMILKQTLPADLAMGVEDIVGDLCSATKKKELECLRMSVPKPDDDQVLDVGTNDELLMI
ncbi:unnamed protein product, partial [Mesorhabditis spiculigera]